MRPSRGPLKNPETASTSVCLYVHMKHQEKGGPLCLALLQIWLAFKASHCCHVLQRLRCRARSSLWPTYESSADVELSVNLEGNLEVKLPTIWTDGKAEVRRVQEEKKRSDKLREEKAREERSCRCTKKVDTSRFSVFSQPAQAAGAEPASQMRATLHYTTLPSTTLHDITLHYTPLHYTYNYNYTPLHSTTLHYTTVH